MGMLEDLLNGAMTGQQGMGQSTTGQAPVQGSGGGMSGTLMTLLPVVLVMLSNRGGAAPQPGAATTGGGLGDILGQVLGSRQQQGGGLGGLLGGMFGAGAAGSTSSAGGLGALLEQMGRAGYGEQARSWVGTGQNMPIAPDAWERILGPDAIAQIAQHAGVSETEASQGLSQLVPQVVDRVTPGGEVPDVHSLAASVDDLARQLRQSQ